MLATTGPDATGQDAVIRTPDQRLRVFVSSTMQELAAERQAVQEAVNRLRLVPVMFELGARPHPPRQLYRAYLAQSQVFVGVYWQSYGWVAPGEELSGLEDEYRLSAGMPRLIYVKSPAPDRDQRLTELLARIKSDDSVSYQRFSDPAELQRLVEDDLALLLSERFEMTLPHTADPAPAGILPLPATPLVDREEEAAEAVDLIVHQGVRLITLTGPGGVGKSRLAVEAAGRLASKFPDGIRFVDLTSVRAADLVPAAIAAGLGLNTSGDRLVSDLVSYLRSKQLLLILDNFEQVTAGATVVADLLAACPGLMVLVTSRTVLRLSGEYELAVPPLPVPPPGAARDPAALQNYASVRLFAARARAEAPGFELTRRNIQAVAEICRRLDGLPLAIELAAARIRLLTPQALLARLDDRMGVLTTGPRDLPERQRTLRNTLDWSFGLLTADEQALFSRLGVFVGSFGLPAVTAVCGDAAAADQADQPGRVVETLSSLVDSSLVKVEPSEDEPRFSLLDTIREYALERLRESGDWQDAHHRHAAYFAALAKPADTELHGAGQLAWLNRLEIRRDNVSAALSWLIEHDQPETALDLVWATWRFWWLHGHAEELARHVDQILAHSDGLPPQQRALALSGARLRPLRRRGPGPGPAAVQTQPPAVHAGWGQARPGPDRGVPGTPAGRVRTRRGLRQRPARTDPHPAAGDGGPAADRAGARAVPDGCRADHQFPRPDQAQPTRSPPRRGAVHRRSECRAQRGRPVHRPDLAVRPGHQPPGRGGPKGRRRPAQAGPVARGRSRRPAGPGLLPRGAGRRRRPAGPPRARR